MCSFMSFISLCYRSLFKQLRFPHPTSAYLGLIPFLAPNSSVLLTQPQERHLWRLKWVGPCYLLERAVLTSWLLASTLSQLIWRHLGNEPVHGSSLPFSAFQINNNFIKTKVSAVVQQVKPLLGMPTFPFKMLVRVLDPILPIQLLVDTPGK